MKTLPKIIGKLIRNPCVNARNRYILSIKAYHGLNLYQAHKFTIRI